MTQLDENKASCMYDDRIMTVAEYKRQPGVSEFERKLKALVMKSANVLTDKTDIRTGKPHRIFNNGFPFGENRRCIQFERGLLPLDPKLEADYWNVAEGEKVSNGETKDNCKNCLQEYVKASNRQKYCESCRDIGEQTRKRAYYNKHKE